MVKDYSSQFKEVVTNIENVDKETNKVKSDEKLANKKTSYFFKESKSLFRKTNTG